jgi:hypothetical protein
MQGGVRRELCAGRLLAVGEGRKQFFFEKKNQKTFIRCGACRSFRARQPTGKSFLFLFFKKEILPALPFLTAAQLIPPG